MCAPRKSCVTARLSSRRRAVACCKTLQDVSMTRTKACVSPSSALSIRDVDSLFCSPRRRDSNTRFKMDHLSPVRRVTCMDSNSEINRSSSGISKNESDFAAFLRTTCLPGCMMYRPEQKRSVGEHSNKRTKLLNVSTCRVHCSELEQRSAASDKIARRRRIGALAYFSLVPRAFTREMLVG